MCLLRNQSAVQGELNLVMELERQDTIESSVSGNPNHPSLTNRSATGQRRLFRGLWTLEFLDLFLEIRYVPASNILSLPAANPAHQSISSLRLCRSLLFQFTGIETFARISRSSATGSTYCWRVSTAGIPEAPFGDDMTYRAELHRSAPSWHDTGHKQPLSFDASLDLCLHWTAASS